MGVYLPVGDGAWGGGPSKLFFHLKWRVLVHSEWHFLSLFSPKNVEFSARSSDLVDVEDVLLRSNEHSVIVLGLVSFLLHCNASNLVLEVLKHDKISVPPLQILGTLPPFFVIYAHGHSMFINMIFFVTQRGCILHVYSVRSTYLANQMPLLATSACNGGGASVISGPPYTNGSYRGNGQPRIPPCCYDNESPSDGDSKATGSVVGHTYQTRE